VRTDQLITDARRAAGLSQAELARRARTSQSAIARYERAVSAPSLATLERVLRACGRPLRLAAARTSPAPTRPRTGPQGALVRRHRARLLAAARRNGARRVRLFGSVARGTESRDSDIDLLVELDRDRTLLDLIAFQQDASDILGRPVDVATPAILKAGFRERVLAEAVPL
jgi:predicted nucleotidyltransferase/DNA-binding XRE family transcriptional regulator